MFHKYILSWANPTAIHWGSIWTPWNQSKLKNFPTYLYAWKVKIMFCSILEFFFTLNQRYGSVGNFIHQRLASDAIPHHPEVSSRGKSGTWRRKATALPPLHTLPTRRVNHLHESYSWSYHEAPYYHVSRARTSATFYYSICGTGEVGPVAVIGMKILDATGFDSTWSNLIQRTAICHV